MGFDESDSDLEELFKRLRLRENDLNKKQTQIHNWMDCINGIKLVESQSWETVDKKQVQVAIFSQPSGPSGDVMSKITRVKDKAKLIENINKFLKQ